MSQENVEIVRRIYAAYTSGDFDAAFALIDPAVKFDGSARPDGKVYRGHAGIVEGLRTWTGTWEAWRMDVEEVIDADGQVVVVERQSGRGKGSGLRFEQQTATIFTLRDRKVIRIRGFASREDALEAAGLSE